MKKKTNKQQAIRALVSGEVIELWLGEPGHPESDCLAQFHTDYLLEVIEQLNNTHKVPKKPANNINYTIRKDSHEK